MANFVGDRGTGQTIGIQNGGVISVALVFRRVCLISGSRSGIQKQIQTSRNTNTNTEKYKCKVEGATLYRDPAGAA